jgi:adenylate kinase
MRIVLVGPPGSGKGTQAKRLCERLSLAYIGTGEILRDAIRRKTPVGVEVEPIIKQGRLVSDVIVNDVVAELFRRPDRPERFVMDGYPRTYSQAIAFDALLRQEYISLDGVVNLTISDDEVVRRISGRRCCSNPMCGICYHIVASPTKTANICDKCGSPLSLRDDDREETVRRRLQEFYGKTDALIDHYSRARLVRNIAATDPVETIYQNIVTALETGHRS